MNNHEKSNRDSEETEKKNKKRKLTVSSHQGDDIFLVYAVSLERKKSLTFHYCA